MNIGWYLTKCECPCNCSIQSFTKWCFNCQIFHIRKINAQIRGEHAEELDKLGERDSEK